QILASAPRDLSRPPTGAAFTDVGHQDFRLDGKRRTRSALVPDLVTSRDCHIQFLAVDVPSILLLRPGFTPRRDFRCQQLPSSSGWSCGHPCHSELAILRLARLT